MTTPQRRLDAYARWKADGRCTNCGASERAEGTQRCVRCRGISRRANLKRLNELRDAAYGHYGGYICACCGETERAFLTIDHIDGGGNTDRRAMVASGVTSVYVWLRKRGYPVGFQVLCLNCNAGRWRNGGTCPHAANRS